MMRKFLMILVMFALLFVTAATVQPAAAWGENGNLIEVKTRAKPYGDKLWQWTIEKSADQFQLLLSAGQTFPVNYSVTVSAAPTGTYGVRGYLRVYNLSYEYPATITATSLLVAPDIYATVTCPTDVVPASIVGASLYSFVDCMYDAPLPNTDLRMSTATASATINGQTYTDSDTDPVDFTSHVATLTETDECIDVTDTNVGSLGTVCANELPKTFTYTLDFGTDPLLADVVLACGQNTHVNTASFVTKDTGATGSDSWTVTSTVACGGGCTLTQGYWKTHSSFGPAPYDDTWALIGENTVFYLSGQSYYQVLWTAPAGNPYYILAHQFIAAKLNGLNGASTPAEVSAALTQAEAFFAAKAPSTQWTKEEKAYITGLASILDQYNNGLLGPGHCSE